MPISRRVDYLSNTSPRCFPDGLDVEVFTWIALDTAHCEATTRHEREHVTPFLCNDARFTRGCYSSVIDESHRRWTVDEPEDVRLCTGLSVDAIITNRPANVLAMLGR